MVTLDNLWEHEFYVLAGTPRYRSLLYGKFLNFRKVSSIKNRKTINKNISFFNFDCVELAKRHSGPLAKRHFLHEQLSLSASEICAYAYKIVS